MAIRLPEWFRGEIKKVVREAMDEWVKDVEYLHQPTDNNGRYYCSKSDCELVPPQSYMMLLTTDTGE